MHNLFVYGTLMKGGKNHHLLANRYQTRMKARMAGLLFDLPYGFPGAVPGEGIIEGEFYSGVDDATLALLDRLEDYREGREDNMYVRERVEVTLEDGSREEAWVYFWARPMEIRALGRRVASGRWREAH